MARIWVSWYSIRLKRMTARMNSIELIVTLRVSYRELSVRAFVNQVDDAPLRIADNRALTWRPTLWCVGSIIGWLSGDTTLTEDENVVYSYFGPNENINRDQE